MDLDLLNKATDEADGFGSAAVASGERCGELVDRARVSGECTRVNVDDPVGRFERRQLLLEALALAAGAIKRHQPRIASRGRRAVANAVDELLDLGLHAGEPAAEFAPPLGAVVRKPHPFGVILLHRCTHRFGMQQLEA